MASRKMVSISLSGISDSALSSAFWSSVRGGRLFRSTSYGQARAVDFVDKVISWLVTTYGE